MSKRAILISIIVLLVIRAAPASSQQPQPEVWVTTQDFSSLRAGPGVYWERLAVVPPASTLRAVGRTVQAHWLQVEYGEQRGWIAARLLIWTGDWMELPVDGVDARPFVRRQEVIAGMQDGVFSRPSSRAADRVTLPAGCQMEITGRLGSVTPLWVQFRCLNRPENVYYWSIAYNPPSQGVWESLPNLASTYAYGRLLEQLRTEFERSGDTYSTIRQIWRSLDAGQSASCNNLPMSARPLVYEVSDLEKSLVMLPAVRATETWIAETNQALELFRQACARQGADRALPPEYVQQAMAHVTAAERAAFFLGTLFNPLSTNDPSFGGGQD